MSAVQRKAEVAKERLPSSALACSFNRSMQHTKICVSRRSVADETENPNLGAEVD
jgi:hypothetical protein